MKSKLVLLISICVTIVISSCTPKLTKADAFPKMYEESPHSILVLPPINESTAAEAKDYYLTTIAEPLAECGYYVFSVEVIQDILKQEGLYDIESVESIPYEKFFEYFGADAVLFTKIIEWNTSYYVIGGNVTVSVDFKLVSTKTSEVIWEYNGTIKVDTSGDSGNAGGLAGLLVLAVTTAVKTAATDYVPQAKKANKTALVSIPVGKYHKKFNKDKKDKVVEKNKMKVEDKK
jgi:hypothetical protein